MQTEEKMDGIASKTIQVEDDRTGMSVETLKRAFADNLFYVQGKLERLASNYDYYVALAYTIRDRLLHRWLKTLDTYFEQEVKVVAYLSAEFLMGRHLLNNIVNLGIENEVREMLGDSCLELEDLLEWERDPGLGNGGLGRLAACFLDSLATLEIPAVGYGIRYEFGIFEQVIQDGWQVEHPDKWLRYGNPWELARPEMSVEVQYGGHCETYQDGEGKQRVRWIPQQKVTAVPYDTPVPGYDTNTVNTLRLWKAEASEDFDFQAFNAGDYDGAVTRKITSETISKVLYPNDNTPQGKQLRLQQQYFFVSASVQDMIRRHLHVYPNLDNFYESWAIQLNDTHPAVAIAELMRLLIDQYNYGWEQAWQITQQTFAYTNHTLLPEALEKWSLSIFGTLLPRHLEIIYDINHSFLKALQTHPSCNQEMLARLSLIEEGSEKRVRMANLACVGSHAVNGVAELHTQLLKQDTLKDFYQIAPQKFYNQTNGVTPRRWILLSNPRLANLISSKIGTDWLKDLQQMRKLEAFIDDSQFCQSWQEIKQQNKQQLAQYIESKMGIKVDVNSLFDIQVKRIHEYKRQLLSVLNIITLYHRLKADPDQYIQPRTFIFAGKAAPGYLMAKLIIKLVNSVAEVVNQDPDVRDRLKVVFLPNFNVSLGQRIYPAADLSEQISTAGKEASGTGNMKFAMNGALTIGTLDGANIEIRQEVGSDNFFLFGLTAQEVYELKANGYNPRHYYDSNPELRQVLDSIAHGEFSPHDHSLFQPIVDSLINKDQYLLFADYQAYLDCQAKVDQAFQNQAQWTKMSILNAARTGKFSSDRTIRSYCEQIWHAESVKIVIDEYSQENANLKGACDIPV